MRKTFIAIVLATLAAGAAAASDQTDALAFLHQWVDAFNKSGDVKSLPTSTCADQASLLDTVPPYAWVGEGACTKWLANFNAFAKSNELTDMSASLGKIRHFEITGDRAYLVAPVVFTYKLKGKPTKESGWWTVGLQRSASGYRVNAWTYTFGKTETVAETSPAK